jgi:hypothetical protein
MSKDFLAPALILSIDYLLIFLMATKFPDRSVRIIMPLGMVLLSPLLTAGMVATSATGNFPALNNSVGSALFAQFLFILIQIACFGHLYAETGLTKASTDTLTSDLAW